MPVMKRLLIECFATYAEITDRSTKSGSIDPKSRFGEEIRRHCFFRFDDEIGVGKRLITADLKQVHIGLVDRVRWVARQFGYKVHTVERGIDPDFGVRQIGKLFGGYRADAVLDIEFNGQLYPDQEPVAEIMVTTQRGIIMAAPGAGKTEIAAAVIARIGKPAFFVTHDRSALEQTAARFSRLLPEVPIGVVGAGRAEIGFITVATRQSLMFALALLEDASSPDLRTEDRKNVLHAWQHVPTLIVDENHHSSSNDNAKLLEEARCAVRRHGLTATPRRERENEAILLEALFGPVLTRVSYGDLIERGRLVPVTFYTAKMPKKRYMRHAVAEGKVRRKEKFLSIGREEAEEQVYDETGNAVADVFREVYADYIVSNPVRNYVCVRWARKMLRKGHSVALIVKEKSHGADLCRALPNAEFIWSGYPKPTHGLPEGQYSSREAAWEALRKRELRVVVSTLLDEALDIPSLTAIVLAAGGKSVTKFVQRLRNLRSFSGETVDGYMKKTRAFVFYPIDQAKWLSDHSKRCLRTISEIVDEHPLNRSKEIPLARLLPQELREVIPSDRILQSSEAQSRALARLERLSGDKAVDRTSRRST